LGVVLLKQDLFEFIVIILERANLARLSGHCFQNHCYL
jgi:hypothetical protein